MALVRYDVLVYYDVERGTLLLTLKKHPRVTKSRARRRKRGGVRRETA